jgi:hypothetical protein
MQWLHRSIGVYRTATQSDRDFGASTWVWGGLSGADIKSLVLDLGDSFSAVCRTSCVDGSIFAGIGLLSAILVAVSVSRF